MHFPPFFWLLFELTSLGLESVGDGPWVVLAGAWSQVCLVLDMVEVADAIVNFNFFLLEFLPLLVQLLQRLENVVVAWSRFFLFLFPRHQFLNVRDLF